MQPFVSAMTSIRQVFLAALKSLLRGKSFIQALFAFWVSPTAFKSSADGTPVERPDPVRRTVQDFLDEAEKELLLPVDSDGLKQLATRLKEQYRECLMANPACMLPSYNHKLPSGRECGQYLTLDVGGSTLRVALVELRSREARGAESSIVSMKSFKITPDIKNLEGLAFFDWMATRVMETVSHLAKQDHSPENPLPVGMAWSFPIEQTSYKGGLLQGMGKGFLAANGLVGLDLGDVIKFACKKQGLNVELSAIVNDSTATLLSQAYINASTRFSLILGTGVNIAVHLPVHTVGRAKFGARPDDWFNKASHVIVNTELGMFGKEALPFTRWDRLLNLSHPKPEFQPLEHFVSGFYLGEVCRLVLVEAIDSTGLFGGMVPPSLLLPYSLDTETLSLIEADTTPNLEKATAIFKSRHPSPSEPTSTDMIVLRRLAAMVSRRSSAIVAAAVFALWELKAESEDEYLRSICPGATPPATPPVSTAVFDAETRVELALDRTMVAYTGSVIEHYPGYLVMCQQYIDSLVGTLGAAPGTIDLVAAKESSLLGAAVALACLQEGKAN